MRRTIQPRFSEFCTLFDIKQIILAYNLGFFAINSTTSSKYLEELAEYYESLERYFDINFEYYLVLYFYKVINS